MTESLDEFKAVWRRKLFNLSMVELGKLLDLVYLEMASRKGPEGKK